jgi:hypothetical protein
MIDTDIFTQLRRGGRSRREVIRMLGALGLVAASMPVVARRASADEDLLVFDWSGYEIPELHKPYIAKYGKSPAITIFADDEEAYIKIKGGFRCDIVHPTSYAIGRYRDQGMLKPIDVSRLSNWPDVMPEVANVHGFTTGDQRWLVPAGWGYNSVIYRTDLVKPKEASWNLLWDGAIRATSRMPSKWMARQPGGHGAGHPRSLQHGRRPVGASEGLPGEAAGIAALLLDRPVRTRAGDRFGRSRRRLCLGRLGLDPEVEGCPHHIHETQGRRRGVDRRLHHDEGCAGQGTERL